MAIKPRWDERIEKSKEELKNPPVCMYEVENIINKGLKEVNIKGRAKLIELPKEGIDYKEIMSDYGTNAETHLIWIQFTNSGHVAVVGGGKDISYSKKRGTGRIIDSLEGIDWCTTHLIIVPIKNLNTKSNGIKCVDNVLRCRNGVEHFIGEYLIKESVPILNFYSHKNYSKEFWEICENNNYILKKK